MRKLFFILLFIVLGVVGFVFYNEQNRQSSSVLIPVNISDSQSVKNLVTKKRGSLSIIFIPSDDKNLNAKAFFLPGIASAIIIDPDNYGADANYALAIANNLDVLLKVDMESSHFPEINPGSDTLLTGISENENIEKFKKILSKYEKCVGIINFDGDRFVNSVKDIVPVLSYLSDSKLIFVDATIKNTKNLLQLKNYTGANIKTCDVFIDKDISEDEISNLLSLLEKIVKDEGYAVGVFKCTPNIIKMLESWLKKIIEEGNVELTPIGG